MKLNQRLLSESRRAQTLLAVGICLGLGGGVMSILQARQVSRVISRVFLEHQTLEQVSTLLLITLGLIVLRTAFTWAGEASGSMAARRIKQDLRQQLFTHIFELGPAYLRSEAGEIQTRTGELVTTATEGIEALEAYFSQYLPQAALAALIPLSILLFVFPIDQLSGVIFLVTAPLLPLFMYLIGSAAQALTRKQWQGLGRMSAYFLDVLQGLSTLKSLGRSREQIEIIKKVSDQYRQTTMNVLKVTFLSALALELIATLSTAVVAVEIGVRLLYGKLIFEQAFFLLLLAPEFYQPLRLLGTRFHAGMAGAEALKRIYSILDLPAPDQSLVTTSPSPREGKENTPPSIAINDASYTYSNGRSALQGVSFDIPPGKITALVGESGAGKTSLTWLLMRFLEPQSGQILVDGEDITMLPREDWLAKLAWVPQNPYLFNDTVLGNIRLAKPDAKEEEIREAAQKAHAEEFILSTPEGYETRVGERGARLSAGQAQRIALARAFLKNAPFLIMDEATSHLDPQTDALVRASLERLAAGRTVLIIAHRQSTLAMADQVVRLGHGRLVDVSNNPADRAKVQIPEGQPAMTEGALPTPSPAAEAAMAPAKRYKKGQVEARLLKLLAPYTGRIFLSVLLGTATIVSGIGLMAAAAYIISAAALHPSIAELQVAIVGVRFFGLSRGVFRYLERLVSHDTTMRLLASWRTWFYQALEPLAPARLMEYHSGDLLRRVISDVGSLENFYVRSLAPPLVALLVGVGTSLFLGSYGAQLAWCLVIFLLLAATGLPILARISAHKLGPAIIHERARLGAVLVDGIQGMPDIFTCGQSKAYLGQVKQAGDKLNQGQMRMSLISATLNAASSLLANLGMLAVLTLAIQRVAQGQLDGVLLGVVSLTAFTCFEAMQPLPQAAQNFDANLTAASRLIELVDTPAQVSDPTEPATIPAEAHLEVQGLSFRYPAVVDEESASKDTPLVLKDISLSLPQGKHLAVVGASGAGKTTLTNILLRFWEYQQGSVRYGEHELRQYRQDDIRRQIAVIAQNTYLFSGTIRDNLLIAHPQATEEELHQAARQAQLHEFIGSLPEGYHTWIGENGLRLSAGERQRLAVARALLKNAPVLILDEPTANLDPETEIAVMNSAYELTQGHSTITITQSMASIIHVDEILVLQDGCVVERGTHEQLLALGGQYQRMWELFHQLL